MSDLDELHTYRWPGADDPGEPGHDPYRAHRARDAAFVAAMRAAINAGKESPRPSALAADKACAQ